jgi:hypothetical protein
VNKFAFGSQSQTICGGSRGKPLAPREGRRTNLSPMPIVRRKHTFPEPAFVLIE